MKKFLFLSFLGFNLLAQPVSHYRIKAELFPEKKILIGQELIQWRNITSHATDQLWFHLYMNAFREGSTFMKEIGGMPEKWKKHKEWWGKIEIKKILVNGRDLTESLRFVSPDDHNSEDRTVAMIKLPFLIEPEQEVKINISFELKIPKIFARAGYGHNYFMFGQWYPKLGVLEEDGWNCHQYHRNSEFYSDFSSYEVTIIVPAEYEVASSGELIWVKKASNGRKIYHFKENMIHDFAWAADVDFVIVKDSFKSSVQPPVNLFLYLQKDHLNQKHRYLRAIKEAMDFFSRKLGPYPYKSLSIVDPDITGIRSAGMEYPKLITGGTLFFLPRKIKFEIGVIHEFGHQYWYGLVANNEFEEAWLDEGINTFFEIEIAKRRGFDPFVKLPFFTSFDFDRVRLDYIKAPLHTPVICPAWKHFPGTYSTNSYSKPAVILQTWKNLMGERIFWKALKTFYERFKFKHPKSEDFFSVMDEVSGKKWDFFYKPLFYSPGKPNWKIYSVKDKNLVLVREGLELNLPVEVCVELKGGKKVEFIWKEGNWLKKEFNEEIRKVFIDPSEKILVDANPLDNSWSTTKSPLVSKLSFKFIRFFQEFLLFFMP